MTTGRFERLDGNYDFFEIVSGIRMESGSKRVDRTSWSGSALSGWLKLAFDSVCRTSLQHRGPEVASTAVQFLRASFRVLVVLIIALPLFNPPASGQARRKPLPRKQKPQPVNPVAVSKADVIKAAREHKTNLEKELALLEAQVRTATEEVDRRRALLAQGLVAKREIESSEQTLEAAISVRNARKIEIGETNNLIAEATAAEQLAKLKPLPMGGYVTTAALIRYIGPTRWFLSDIGKVQSFFTQRFGHNLPVSAFGQTPVHDRMGFDHHEAVDVAAHPDSPEGRAIMAYLQSAGISFIAFRQAVAGSATGAHIHIGQPSRRLAR